MSVPSPADVLSDGANYVVPSMGAGCFSRAGIHVFLRGFEVSSSLEQ